MSFSGKVVIVTGASSGIGAATAILFTAEGAKVTIVGRNEKKLANVAERCAAKGSPPLVIRADVANEEQVKGIVKQTIDKFGKLDILVNNAGVATPSKITDPNILKTFDAVMNTNLRSAVQLTNLAAPHLIATKGNIVNISSIVSQKVYSADSLAYSVSKIGLDHFTRCVALELAPSGVRVNSVNPGPVRTDIAENSGMVPAGGGDALWEQAKSGTALGTVAEPEEIADLIAYLASDKAKSITGSIYVTDCGVLLK